MATPQAQAVARVLPQTSACLKGQTQRLRNMLAGLTYTVCSSIPLPMDTKNQPLLTLPKLNSNRITVTT